MRIVLDSTILVRANDSATGLGRQLLLILLKANHTLIVSGEILHEVAKVLRYPRFRKFHTLTEDGIYQYIAFLRDVAEITTLDRTLAVADTGCKRHHCRPNRYSRRGRHSLHD